MWPSGYAISSSGEGSASPHAIQWGIAADANAARRTMCAHLRVQTSLSIVFRDHIHRNAARFAPAGSAGGRISYEKVSPDLVANLLALPCGS